MTDALGMIETRGFAAMVEASDAMVKAAKVELVSYEKIGGGYVTAIVRGDVAAGKEATPGGVTAAAPGGGDVHPLTFPPPHRDWGLVRPFRGLRCGRKTATNSQ